MTNDTIAIIKFFKNLWAVAKEFTFKTRVVNQIEIPEIVIAEVRIPEYPDNIKVNNLIDYSPIIKGSSSDIIKYLNGALQKLEPVKDKQIIVLLEEIKKVLNIEKKDLTPEIINEIRNIVKSIDKKDVDLSGIERKFSGLKKDLFKFTRYDEIKVRLPDKQVQEMAKSFIATGGGSTNVTDSLGNQINPAKEDGNLANIKTGIDKFKFSGDDLKVKLDSDIEIGAVELKDHNSDTRVDIEQDVAKNALYVQSESLLTELQLKANLTETQPVSNDSLPLPTGAATSAKQLDDNHQVTVSNPTTDPETGLATSAKQLANDHDVNVSNQISGFATLAKQLADNHNVTISNPTTDPETGLAKEDKQDDIITKQDDAIAELQKLIGFEIPKYDYIALSYTEENLTGVVYKTGGSEGTTVATLALAYTGAVLNSVTKV